MSGQVTVETSSRRGGLPTRGYYNFQTRFFIEDETRLSNQGFFLTL